MCSGYGAGVAMHKILIGLAIAALSASANAQDVPIADDAAPAQPAQPAPTNAQVASATKAPTSVCELHVWPADDIQSVSQGWMQNNTVNQDFNTAKGGKPRPDTLAADRQLALIKSMDLPAVLGLEARKIVTHLEPLSRNAAAATTRNAASDSTCYDELVVSKLFYDRAPVAGRSLKAMIVLRRFGDAPELKSSFATWAETGLKVYPAATPDQSEAAEAELAAAYQNNLRKFAGYVTAPKKPKKR